MKKQFKIYLENATSNSGNRFSMNSINMMIKELDTLIPQEMNTTKSLLSTRDIDEIRQIKNRLSVNGDLHGYNQNRSRGGPSKAVYNYLKFLNQDSQ